MLTITPARYAKGKMSAQCSGDGSGFKDREQRLCEAIGGRWSNRCHSYILSRAQARDVLILAAAGWDAYTIFGREDGREFLHYENYPGQSFTRKEALALCSAPVTA